MVELLPAILTKSLETFQLQVHQAENFATMVHVDVTDGIATPFRSLGMTEIASNRPSIPFEIHAMLQQLDVHVHDFLELAPVRVIVDPKTTKDFKEFCQRLKEKSIGCGVFVTPASHAMDLRPFLSLVEQVTFVTVTAGAQGGSLQRSVIAAARAFRQDHPRMAMEIDGGVKQENTELVLSTQPDRVAVGSALWESNDPQRTYTTLSQAFNRSAP